MCCWNLVQSQPTPAERGHGFFSFKEISTHIQTRSTFVHHFVRILRHWSLSWQLKSQSVLELLSLYRLPTAVRFVSLNLSSSFFFFTSFFFLAKLGENFWVNELFSTLLHSPASCLETHLRHLPPLPPPRQTTEGARSSSGQDDARADAWWSAWPLWRRFEPRCCFKNRRCCCHRHLHRRRRLCLLLLPTSVPRRGLEWWNGMRVRWVRFCGIYCYLP